MAGTNSDRWSALPDDPPSESHLGTFVPVKEEEKIRESGDQRMLDSSYGESEYSGINVPLLEDTEGTNSGIWICRLFLLFWVISTILIIVYRKEVTTFVRSVATWASRQGRSVYLYHILLFALTLPLFISVEILLISSGFIFSHIHGQLLGVIVGTCASFVGYFLGTLICFLLSRYLLHALVRRYMRSYRYYGALNRATEKEGFMIVAIIRLSPLFPAAIVSYIFGNTNVGIVEYSTGSVAAIPSLAFFTYIGSLLEDFTSENDDSQSGFRATIFLCISVLISLVCIYYATILTKRHLEQNPKQDETESWQ